MKSIKKPWSVPYYYVDGGAGDDRLYAEAQVTTEQAIRDGNNSIGTGMQGDWLTGNSGDDTLVTREGNDVLYAVLFGRVRNVAAIDPMLMAA